MLTIRAEQMQALSRAREEDFLRRAEGELHAILPDTCAPLGPDGVRSIVRQAYQKAGDYGFTTDYDLLRFINLTFALGPGFDAEPWAAEVLANESYDLTMRLDLVDQLATLALMPPEEPPALDDEEMLDELEGSEA